MEINQYEGFNTSIQESGIDAFLATPVCYVSRCLGSIREYCLANRMNFPEGSWIVHSPESDGSVRFHGSFESMESAFDYSRLWLSAVSFRPSF